jgi:hypothetical protein
VPEKNGLSEGFFSKSRFAPALIFLSCFIAYFNSFHNEFLFDDHVVLFGQKGVAGKAFHEVLFSNQGGDFYRPAGHVLLWMSSRLFGHNVVDYHAFSFLLFCLIVLFFYKITRELTGDKDLAFLTAWLYAVHPVNGFIVNYVTASVIASFVLFMQAGFWFFLKFCHRGRKLDYGLSFLFLVLASMAHEMVIMLPAIMLAYLFYCKRAMWRRWGLYLLPFAGYLAAWFIWRSRETFFHIRLNNLHALEHVGGTDYFSTWMDLVRWYVGKLFSPRDILFLWSQKYGEGHFGVDLILLAVFLATLIWAHFKWKPEWKPFMAAAFVIGLLPSLFSCFVYFPFDWPFIEAHWFYFSEMGFFALAAWLLMSVVKSSARAGGLLTAGVITVLVVLCWENNAHWKNQETYSNYWLSVNPGNLTPYYWLGRTYMERGDYPKAAQIFETGYKSVHTLSYNLAGDWGHCLDVMGGHDKEASDLLYTAKLLDPNYGRTRYYIGYYFLRHGHPGWAKLAFQKALQLDPAMASMPLMEGMQKTR